MSESLRGKVAVVTGGGGVLCSMMAAELARNGAKVAVSDRDLDKANRIAEEIVKNGGIAIGVAFDVLNKEAVEKAAAEILEKLGPCDILVNGAGGNHPTGTTTNETLQLSELTAKDENVRTFFDMSVEGFDFTFRLNFMGTLIPSQVFARQLAGRPGTTIINISSMSSLCPLTKVPAYSAAKAAINNFTQWMAVHLADVGIRVNAMAPGFFLTEQNRTLLTKPDGSWTPRAEKVIAHTPMRRMGTPEDLLGTLIWMADEKQSGFVTGVVVAIDGGFMAYSGV